MYIADDDRNGVIEKNYNKYGTVTGIHGESASNNNGLVDFYINHDLIITDTLSKHKKIRHTQEEGEVETKNL